MTGQAGSRPKIKPSHDSWDTCTGLYSPRNRLLECRIATNDSRPAVPHFKSTLLQLSGSPVVSHGMVSRSRMHVG